MSSYTVYNGGEWVFCWGCCSVYSSKGYLVQTVSLMTYCHIYQNLDKNKQTVCLDAIFSYFCSSESLKEEVLLAFPHCGNHNTSSTSVSPKGKYSCMVHLSLWPVTQAARHGTSADVRYGEVPKSQRRALGGEGHR